MNTYLLISEDGQTQLIEAYNIDIAVYKLRKVQPKSKFKIASITDGDGKVFNSVKELRYYVSEKI